MSDAQVSQEQPVAEAKTLDDVVSEFNVQPPAQQAAPQPAQQSNVTEFQSPSQPQKIDPYDEDSLNKWAMQTQQSQQSLHGEIENLKAQLTAQQEAAAKQVIEADIKKAVSTLSEKVEGLDPLMAELYLNKRAEENAGFKAIWENRGSNPDAFNAALDAISRELDGRFSRVDPQIAENHRAAQQSTQSSNTPARTEFNNSLEERLANAANERERAIIWNQIKNGGY